jgi:predicted Fe-S protein YdhL (DUF1289 family)
MKKAKAEEDVELKSPCRKKCSLDRNKICPACFRSIEEIVSWPDADKGTKRRILEAAKQRRIDNR